MIYKFIKLINISFNKFSVNLIVDILYVLLDPRITYS